MTVELPPSDPPPEGCEEPAFKVPFAQHDREALEACDSPALTLLDMAESAGDRLDAGALAPQEQLSSLRALEAARRHIDALSTDLIAAFDRSGTATDHGYRTTEQLLQGEFRITVHEARRRVRLGRLLGERATLLGERQVPVRPLIAENLAAARISADEARVLCDAVEDLPPQIRAEYGGRVEATLVELAPTLRLRDIPKLAGRIVQTIDPDGTPPQFTPEPHKHHITLNQKVNGDWRLSGLLDCPTGTTLYSLLYARMRDTDAEVRIRPHTAASGDAAAPEGSATGLEGSPDCLGAGSADPTANTGASPTGGSSAQKAPDQDMPVQPSPEHADALPRISEAVWERTRVTVDSEGRTVVSGAATGEGTLMEDDRLYLMGDDGWPVPISARISDAAFELLAEARSSTSGSASTVLWEKTVGRAAADHDAGPEPPPDSSASPAPPNSPASPTPPTVFTPPPRTGPPPDADLPPNPGPELTAGAEAPRGGPAPPHTTLPPDGMPPCPPEEVATQPVVVGSRNPGVREDGTRSTVTPEPDSHSPGRQRHDRLGFLLRCLGRERVLHGADHALVVSATAQELARPHQPLSTQTGGTTTPAQLSGWSDAIQMFAHITDGRGRTVAVRSRGRFATRSQIAILTARDQGCTFPDCDAPAAWCEAHHIVRYSEGGPTEIGNLTLICPFHHRWFERSGWTGQLIRGLPAWTPPAHIDRSRKPVFHSRFRAALMGLPRSLGGRRDGEPLTDLDGDRARDLGRGLGKGLGTAD
ncbi:HNH endonuclease signature motif containing protein [Brevibacterium album]|uniref:HNH endonuclease signature motif containing protein n=1 Tax=Brevibacterium album TaxID=417948 RepID=UPI00041B73FB|nr:HNH endonuclease signature motif containing protein [Brevibacterium album]